jgi:hypothetical protein
MSETGVLLGGPYDGTRMVLWDFLREVDAPDTPGSPLDADWFELLTWSVHRYERSGDVYLYVGRVNPITNEPVPSAAPRRTDSL